MDSLSDKSHVSDQGILLVSDDIISELNDDNSTENLFKQVESHIHRISSTNINKKTQNLLDNNIKQDSLDILRNYDDSKRIYSSGMKPSTIMVEMRRKAILSALLSQDLQVENEYIQCYNKLHEVKSSSMIKDGHLSQSSIHTDHTKKVHKFKPLWENYDIMKTRWRYIKPQSLIKDSEMIVPVKNGSIIRVQDKLVVGSYQHIHQHLKSSSKL